MITGTLVFLFGLGIVQLLKSIPNNMHFWRLIYIMFFKLIPTHIYKWVDSCLVIVTSSLHYISEFVVQDVRLLIPVHIGQY